MSIHKSHEVLDRLEIHVIVHTALDLLWRYDRYLLPIRSGRGAERILTGIGVRTWADSCSTGRCRGRGYPQEGGERVGPFMCVEKKEGKGERGDQ